MRTSKSVFLFFSLFLINLTPILSAAADDWPVAELSFTIEGKAGWLPKKVSVKEGSEVKLTLVNKSSAPACFEIADSQPGKFVKKAECVDTGMSRKVTFFANVPKGTYPIRNLWEQQQAGEFMVE